ncbi:MAG: S8 family serine peptidase [Gemmobacter sp.]
MTLTWGPWRADPSADPSSAATYATPYGDWYEAVEHQVVPFPDDFQTCSQAGAAAAFPQVALPRITLPHRALPPGGVINPPGPRPSVIPGLTGPLTRHSVVVGVIDAGVALAHDRFRRPGGGTRILSAWLQGGVWAGQAHLPFGRELMQADIDGHMTACTTALGVDEGAFNRRAGLVDYADPASERWVDTAAPHGTHVADLAAGFDPDAAGTARDSLPMIVVDLAPRIAIGPSGSFLESYVMWAIRHIATTADAIWDAVFGADDPQGQGGFPIVINLSYGLLAGPKDGTMAIQKYMAGLNAGRPGRPPLAMVLPAGNDNLEQGTATLTVPTLVSGRSISWRISPEDRTSNYAEVWTQAYAGPPVPGAVHPLAIRVFPPDGPEGPGTAGAAGQVCDLTRTVGGVSEVVARIYCRQNDNAMPPAPATSHRLSYVICAAPSWRAVGHPAPSGAWTIRLTVASGDTAVTARLHVQSDQDLTPGNGTGLMSRFEHPDYATHDAAGRLNDTYFRDYVTDVVTPNFSAGPVKRRNTINAIAGSAGALTIGGYRRSDGMPAEYSSAGQTMNGEDPHPDFACASDDGVWRIGRLAAGGRSGSAAVLQGTSFATGEATRIVALDLLRQMAAGVAGPMLKLAGADFVANVPDPYPVVPPPTMPASAMPLKLGLARLAVQDHGRPAR